MLSCIKSSSKGQPVGTTRLLFLVQRGSWTSLPVVRARPHILTLWLIRNGAVDTQDATLNTKWNPGQKFWFQELEFLPSDFFTILFKWNFVLHNPVIEKTERFFYISCKYIWVWNKSRDLPLASSLPLEAQMCTVTLWPPRTLLYINKNIYVCFFLSVICTNVKKLYILDQTQFRKV